MTITAPAPTTLTLTKFLYSITRFIQQLDENPRLLRMKSFKIFKNNCNSSNSFQCGASDTIYTDKYHASSPPQELCLVRIFTSDGELSPRWNGKNSLPGSNRQYSACQATLSPLTKDFIFFKKQRLCHPVVLMT